MIFKPGEYYYRFSVEDMALLQELFEVFGEDYGVTYDEFIQDFELIDGYYYSSTSNTGLTADELRFIDDNGFMHPLSYIKSVESTSPAFEN